MRISVIIPVYNRVRTIRRALDSVLGQTRPADEIIVVDDGSDNETPHILNDYKSEIKIIRQAHLGVSAARNAGIKAAEGNWLAFLDSDDQWFADKLKMAEDFHLLHPEYRIFQTDEMWIRKGQRVNPKKKHRKVGGWIFRESLPLCIVSPSAVVIEKALLDEVGLFDEEFPVCEDYDLWLRIARKYEIGLDNRIGIIKYGGHEDQLSRQYWGMDRYRLKAMDKHAYDPTLPDEWRLWLLEEAVRKLQILIQGAQKRKRPEPQLMQQWQAYQKKLDELQK